MNISTQFLQKYYPTRKLYAWALAFIYIAPISLLAAQQKEDNPSNDEVVTFITKDLKTLASKNENEKITQNDLASKWAQKKLNETKSNSRNDLIEALKKDHAFIIKAASTLLIENGGNNDTREQLNLLTEGGIGLIEKKDFNLDGLKLEILAGFYDNENKIKIITDILTAQKDEVTKKIGDELKGGGKAWEHLQCLLDFDGEQGISHLNLSYKTIDLSFKLFLNHIENDSCHDIIVDMGEKGPENGLKYIQSVLDVDVNDKKNVNDKKLEGKKIWKFLGAALKNLSNDKLKTANNVFNAFTVKKYLGAKKSIEPAMDKNDKNIVVEVTKKILQNPATAKSFAQEAFNELKNLHDEKSIKAIWEILSSCFKDSFDSIQSDDLEKLNYEQLSLCFNTSWVDKTTSQKGKGALLKWLLIRDIENKSKKKKKEKDSLPQKVANKAFEDNNQKSSRFWRLLYFLVTDTKGPKVDATKIGASKMILSTALEATGHHKKTLIEILKKAPDQYIDKRLLKEACKNADNVEKLVNLLREESNDIFKKIDATDMTLEAARKAAKRYPQTLEKILENNTNKVKPLLKAALQNNPLKNGEFIKFLLKNYSNLLKNIDIIKEASTLLIDYGHYKDTRELLDLLTKDGIGLIEKKDFNLDKLTIGTLVGFYREKDNIEIITAILQAQNDEDKKKVSKKIMEELTEVDSCFHLNELLNYDDKKGIPALNLSYEKIDTTKIPKELFTNYANKKHLLFDKQFTEAVQNIAQKQPSKLLDFIQKALDVDVNSKEEVEKIWDFLRDVLITLDNHKPLLNDKQKEEAYSAFTVKKYLQAKTFIKPNDKDIVFKVIKKILKNSATAERFANEAFEKDNQNSENLWDLLHCLIMDPYGPKVDATKIDASKMTLQTALKGAKDYPRTLKKIFKQDHKERAIELVKEALKGDNQNSENLWDLLHCLIMDPYGPKVDATKIDASKMTLQTALKGAEEYPVTLINIFKKGPEKNKERAIELVNEALKSNNSDLYNFWDLINYLISYTTGPQVDATKIDATDITLDTALDVTFEFSDAFKKILKQDQNKHRALELSQEVFTGDNQTSANFWYLLHCLIIDTDGPEVDATQIDATNMTLQTALNGAETTFYSIPLMKILKQDKNKHRALELSQEVFTGDNQTSGSFWDLLHYLITDTDGPEVDATQIDATNMTLDTALRGTGYYRETLIEVLKQNQARALTLSEEAFTHIAPNSKNSLWELLHYLVTYQDGPKVDAQQINIQKFDEKVVFHAFSTQGMKKDVIESLLRSHPNQAKELVKKILSNQNLLSTQNIELLYWLIFDSHTNNQGAIVPPTAIDITSQRVIEILQRQPNQKLSEIVKSAINIQPSIGKGMLEIAINGQTGSPFNWSNANVDFNLLHLLMLDPNGPRLTIERADVGNLDLSAIESHISKPNALELFKKILHNLKNIETFNAFRYAIFPSNSNSNNTFDYQNVDWDTTKWDSIPTLKELIKSIDIPEDIVVKKLQDDGFTHKAIVKDIVLTSSSNLLEKVLNIAFPNVTVTSTTPTPTIAWPQSLSETNWDIVASLTDSQHGIITAKEVIQKVVPGISSSDAHFARDYDLSSVRWGDFDWEAFEDLAERSNIANFSTQNYQTIAENVLPGLQFVDQAPKVSQIRWSEVKSYKVVNFLIAKKIISEKILINAPRSLLKQRINNISRLSLAEADFWKDAQEEKSKYYWSFAPYVVGFVLASSIALLYAFNKQTKKQEKKRGSHNKESLKKEAKVKTRHSINNRQFHKIRSS